MQFELKKWSISYKNDLIEAFKDAELVSELPDSYPFPFEETHAQYFLEQRLLNSEKKQICRAIVADNKVIGAVEVILGSGIYSRNGQLSVWISKPYRRQGIASEAVRQICDIAFNDYNAVRIAASVISHNRSAIAFMEHAGFVYEGTVHKGIYENDTLYDYCIYAIIRQ